MKKLSDMLFLLGRKQLIIAMVLTVILLIIETILKVKIYHFVWPVILILSSFVLFLVLAGRHDEYLIHERRWEKIKKEIEEKEKNLAQLLSLTELPDEDITSAVKTSVQILYVNLILSNSEHDINEIRLKLKEKIRETKISLIEKRIELIDFLVSDKHKKYLILRRRFSPFRLGYKFINSNYRSLWSI